MLSPHSGHLERWIGANACEQVSAAMRGSHFDPIQFAVGDGSVFVGRDGDFSGRMGWGYFASYNDWIADRQAAIQRLRRVYARRGWKQNGTLTGRDSMIAAISGGKSQMVGLGKTGVTGVANISNSLWDVGAQPAAGSTSAAGAGSSPTNATTGGFLYDNASGGDTMHFLGCTVVPTVGNNLLLLYDRFFQVNHNIATDPQAISGTPTRYQDTTAKNTFLSVFVTTALGAGTPTLTISYVDDAGNTAEAAAAQTIVASAIARRFPFAASVGNGWFIPLNSGDRGVRALTNSDLSAASTGNIDLVLGKPIAWIPCPVANQPIFFDATLTPACLQPIAASACLAINEINKGATTATSYSGSITVCSG